MERKDDERRGKSPSQPAVLPSIASAEKPRRFKKPLSFYLSLFGLALVALISSWDATSLAIALPVITSQLHGTTLESFWASISFTLGVTITQPIYVSLSDVLGRKPPLYAAMTLFAVGAVILATANNMATLVAGRLIQGLGGGGLYVLLDIILADMTTLKERPLYLGLIAIAMAMGTILGPILGAIFAEFADWRWVGWINLPIVGIGGLIFVFCLHLASLPLEFTSKLRRVDWIGMLLFAAGATAVALPLSWAGSLYPWSSWKTILPFTVGLVLLIVFGLYERKTPQEPVLPYRIFSNITASATLITGFFHGAVMYTILLYLPLFFQAVFLEAPLQAGISILPVCCLTVGSSFIASVVIELTRRYRLLLWLGWSFITLFLGLWCRVSRDTTRAEVYAFQCMLGIGIGSVFTGAQVSMQASVTHVDNTGLAVGTLVVIRIFGALFGLSIGSTAFSSVFQKAIAAVGTLPEAVQVLEDPTQGVNFIPVLRTLELPDESMGRIVNVYRQSFQAIWIVVTCFAGIGFLTSFLIKELSLEKEEVGMQGFEHPSRKDPEVPTGFTVR